MDLWLGIVDLVLVIHDQTCHSPRRVFVSQLVNTHLATTTGRLSYDVVLYYMQCIAKPVTVGTSQREREREKAYLGAIGPWGYPTDCK